MWEKARKMEVMEKLLAKSNLTEEDALEIGRKIKKSIAQKHNLFK
jgi:uncharacterized protein (UPF0303 family)